MKNKTEKIKLEQYCKDFKARNLCLIKYSWKSILYFDQNYSKSKLKKSNLAAWM